MRNQAQKSAPLSSFLPEHERRQVPEKCLQMVRKCKCGSPQCPECQFISWVPRESKTIKSYHWQFTREIVLTIDPSLFNSPGEALDYVKKHKSISIFMRNLQRGRTSTRGAAGDKTFIPFTVVKWRVHQEFTRKGWPHWHILIEVQKIGKAGMIGEERIHHYWKLGKYAYEQPIKSAHHWQRKVGDFQKLGYWLQDKQYQTDLPAWAREYKTRSIRRAGGSVLNKSAVIEIEPGSYNEATINLNVALMVEILQYLYPKPIKIIKTYGEILDGCGQKVWVRVLTEKYLIEGIYNIPYCDIRGDKTGTYFEKVGYIVRGDVWDILRLKEKIDVNLRVLRLEDSDWKYDRRDPDNCKWISRRGESYG